MKAVPFAFLAETEPLELQHVDHRIIVVGFKKIDIVRSDRCLRVERVAIHRPAAAILHRIVGKGIVPLNGAEQSGEAQAKFYRGRAPHHQKSLRAGARHDAVEQSQRVGH